MRVTIRDIAARCEVDVSTVSRALRDDPRVTPITRTRIQKIAKDMGYRPNLAARALVAGKTWTLWFITASVQNPLDRAAAESAAAWCRERGYDLLVGIHHNDPTARKRLVTRLGQGIADGAIIVPDDDSEEQRILLAELMTRNIPFIFLDRYPREGVFRAVTSDNVEAGRHLAEWCSAQDVDLIISDLASFNSVISLRRTAVHDWCEAHAPGKLVQSENLDASHIARANRIAVIANCQDYGLRVVRQHAEHFSGKTIYFGIFDEWIGDPAPAVQVCVARQDFRHMAEEASRLLVELVETGDVPESVFVRTPMLRYDIINGVLPQPQA